MAGQGFFLACATVSDGGRTITRPPMVRPYEFPFPIWSSCSLPQTPPWGESPRPFLELYTSLIGICLTRSVVYQSSTRHGSTGSRCDLANLWYSSTIGLCSNATSCYLPFKRRTRYQPLQGMVGDSYTLVETMWSRESVTGQRRSMQPWDRTHLVCGRHGLRSGYQYDQKEVLNTVYDGRASGHAPTAAVATTTCDTVTDSRVLDHVLLQ